MKTEATVWLTAITMIMMQHSVAQQQLTNGELALQWSTLPDLPDSLGVAGAFVGISNGTLVVAGGSNFSKPLWAGGKKQFLSSIHVLHSDGQGGYVWVDGGSLPVAVSNGSAVCVAGGILCIGGSTTNGDIADVLLLRWNSDERKVEIVRYPSLPNACSYSAAVAIDDTVYVTGGKNEAFPDGMCQFLRLDSSLGSEANWEHLPDLPLNVFSGVLVAQHDGYGLCIFQYSGKSASEYSTAVYAYPVHGRSSHAWIEKSPMPYATLAATAVGRDDHEVLVFGGSDGHNIANRLALKDDYHLSKGIIKYNAVNDTWCPIGDMPLGIVSTTAVWWNGLLVFPGGELGNAMRTNKVLALKIGGAK